ncbi:MAG: outer membrane protein assembly factor BamA [Gammaproteobacteria bacterium]|nr:outer membrane protein assembly factor BamA [Gammaproteobacteria bacterium]
MNQLRRYFYAVVFTCCAVAAPVQAFEPFMVDDIRIEGLQRVTAGTVFNYLPVQMGSRLDERGATEAIRELFKTGFFKDVRLERDGDVLVVFVRERPSIANIEISGNSAIETDQILEQLKSIGFAEGRVFEQAQLESVQRELQNVYFSLGKYSATIEPTVTPLERNRVGVSLDIEEGDVARIKQINIVGNKAYDEDELLDLFQLSTGGLLSFIYGDDQYSKQKLAGDLETLRSHYLDSGFINFNVESTQVTLTPDREQVYITINITEGDRHVVDRVKLAGDLVLPEEELFKLLTIGSGDVFSRRKVTATSEAITTRLGEEGYAFANVNAVPEIDDEDKTVELTFFMDPGKRVYVRRINVKGNTRTRDEVLRREMRQLEGAWIDTSKVDLSKQRLDRLGYFQEVNVETPPVPGTTDQVDVDFTVAENPSGNLIAGAGFSQSQGIIFSTSISQDNFLGSGKRIGLAFNNSDVNTVYSFSYDDPYWTIDGVSLGFSLFSRETDAEEANVSDFTTDRLGGALRFGLPISEFERIFLGVGIENTAINLGSFPSTQIVDFLDREGDEFTSWTLTAAWSHDSRNRAIFPDRGVFQRFSGEVAMPGGDLNYYKVTYRHDWYIPLSERFTLLLKGDVGYGDAYGDTGELPFFENFFAGGVRSVRGFEDNTLGPRDSQDDPLGGDVKLVGNAELLLPVPFAADSKSLRMSAFADAGNVFGPGDDVDTNNFRFSVGVGVTWLSPLGALTFSIAQPLNDEDGDEVQNFQFTFGNTF